MEAQTQTMEKHLSQSQIKLFKACRRAYELKYVYDVVPVQTAETLRTGKAYHALLEELYKTGDFEADFSKESAMATAYKKYIYPKFKVRSAEDWLKYDDGSGMIPLTGRADGIAEDGRLVEHKTTSIDPLEYEYNLQWDEQILAYMLMTGARSCYYTICRKPTIRLKKNETEEEFFQRMVEWYDEDTEHKLVVFLAERTDEEVQAYKEEFESIRAQMLDPNVKYYKNTCHCNAWGRRCEYSPICMHYNPDETYIEFKRREYDG